MVYTILINDKKSLVINQFFQKGAAERGIVVQ